MSIKEFLERQLSNMLMIQAGIGLAMGVLGSIYEPETKFGWKAFFVPLVYAFFCTLPGFVGYSAKELTMKQMLIRELIYFLLVELTMLSLLYVQGALKSMDRAFALAAAVLAVYLIISLAGWLRDGRVAKDMNEQLRKMKKQ